MSDAVTPLGPCLRRRRRRRVRSSTPTRTVHRGLLEEMISKMPDVARAIPRRTAASPVGEARGRPSRHASLRDAEWYVERLRAAGVSKALVMSVAPDNQWTRDFLVAANGHVHALCGVDPRDPGAPALLEREVAAGFRGVKLLPSNRCYRVSDPACRPLFEKVAELGVSVTIHYGVTVDPTGDMRYADPTDLSR